jgi:hypothetical protein
VSEMIELTIKVTQFCIDAKDLSIPTAHRCYLGMENTTLNKICLNLKRIKKYSVENHLSFNKVISQVITHETIHYILDINENQNVSFSFDNISRKLKEYGCI